MRCYECGVEYQECQGRISLFDDVIGHYSLDNVNYKKCESCGEKILSAEAWEAADRKVAEMTTDLVGKLPISEFVGANDAAVILGITRQALHKHRRINRGFVHFFINEKKRFYHVKSVELFKETGDGRFPLVAEAAWFRAHDGGKHKIKTVRYSETIVVEEDVAGETMNLGGERGGDNVLIVEA